MPIAKPTPPPPQRSLLGMFLAGAAGLIICVLLFLATLSQLGPVIAIGGGVFALAVFHYLVWGWWLGKLIRADVEAEKGDTAGR